MTTAAVVGTGFIGPVHIEALQRIGVHVQGILGSTPEKSAQAAAQLGPQQAMPVMTICCATRLSR